EGEADRGPERHRDVEEHGHPRRGDVDIDDAIGLALRGVGRGYEETRVQARDAEEDGEHRADARDLSRERKERLRRGVPEPLDAFSRHSSEILSAAAVAHGAKTAATISIAPRSRSCPEGESPAPAISTAPAPRISTGT